MLRFEAVAKALGGELARRIAGKTERKRDFRAEERIAERIQHKREGAFGDVALVMANRKLRDEAVNRIEDRVQRVAVAAEDHPGGQRSGTLAPERVEALIDNHPRVGLTGACAFDCIGDALRDRIGDRAGELALEAGRLAEMVKQIGVSPADLGGDRLQGHGLRPLFNQQPARRGERRGAALFGTEAGSSY
jgi:hypothetical protein